MAIRKALLLRSRLLSMLVTGLLLAVLFLIAVQITQTVQSQFFGDDEPSEEVGNAELLTVRPILIESVSESDNILSISGTGHPDIPLTVNNFGESLAQIKSDENGVWSVDIPITNNRPFNLRLMEYISEDSPVLADETIYRIPPPPVDEASVDQFPLALILVTAPGKPSSVFQSPFRGLPTSGGISMGAIDYDESGGVIFAGTSDLSGRVRVFANNTAIGEAAVDGRGRWNIIAPDTLPAGQFDIGAAHLTENGILSQVQVPFERLTVANGDPEQSLEVFYMPYSWQVRRRLIGGGYQYTAIFAPREASAIIPQ